MPETRPTRSERSARAAVALVPFTVTVVGIATYASGSQTSIEGPAG